MRVNIFALFYGERRYAHIVMPRPWIRFKISKSMLIHGHAATCSAIHQREALETLAHSALPVLPTTDIPGITDHPGICAVTFVEVGCVRFWCLSAGVQHSLLLGCGGPGSPL